MDMGSSPSCSSPNSTRAKSPKHPQSPTSPEDKQADKQMLPGVPQHVDDNKKEGGLKGIWSKEAADKLQKSVDAIFGAETGSSLFGLEFSFTIADPFLDDCPLIGCSTGFSKLCGYGLPDILGRNCRFLIDRVPQHLIDNDVRRHAKDFCKAALNGSEYRVPESDRKAWMPVGRPADELICMQKNIRKDGTLFNNMFYMKVFWLSSELGEGQPYVVALQSELKDDAELAALAENLSNLDVHMKNIKKELSSMFFMQCSMDRQLRSSSTKEAEEDEPGEAAPCNTPKNLHQGFDPSTVETGQDGRFKPVQKLCDATRNRGVVQLMQDTKENKLVAAKRMPTAWLCKSHEEFLKEHPNETEMPWQDVGCTRYLNSVNYKYACQVEGVWRNAEHTFFNFSYAPGGDLFSVALSGTKPGPEREAIFARLVPEIFTSVKQLHDMEIAHRDISLENVLLTTDVIATSEIRIIDYAMASRDRIFRNCVRGKPSYQAPEMHEKGLDYDAFLTDSFSIGVVLYSLFLRDYPWLSTKPGACMHFEYVKKHGFRSYCAKRKVRGSTLKVAQCISEPLLELLEGLLEMDPQRRLSLGESHGAKRRSVWDEPFTATCQKA